MGTDQRFSLRWNNYQSHLVTAFESLLEEKDFVDVTLGVEGRKLPAHKMLLSACSPYFRDLLKGNPCQHPIIILRDIKYDDLFSLLQFMYNGEVNVAQEQLNSFLKSAESLKIRGLTDNDAGGGGVEEPRTAPQPPRPPSRDNLQPPPIKRKRPYPDLAASPVPTPKRAPLPHQPPPQHLAPPPRPEPVKQEVIELGDEQYEADQGAYDADGGGDSGGGYQGAQGYAEEGAMVPHGEGEEGMEGAEGAQGLHQFYGSEGNPYLSASQHPFPCEHCNKTFTTPGSLRNHAKVHTGATWCIVCKRQLATVSSLNRHMKTEHRDFVIA